MSLFSDHAYTVYLSPLFFSKMCLFMLVFFFSSCPHQSRSLPLTAMRRLLHLRGALTDFSLTMLEEHCTEKSRQALARERMTAGELALEEFIHCTPEPNSIKEVRQKYAIH